MMKRTMARFSSMMDNFSKDMNEAFEEMDKEMDDLMKDVDILPDGISETKTEEIETKPDGTIIKRTVIRRSSVAATTKTSKP